jgi:hypothetical protein
MTPPILDEPIRGAVQERRKSRSMLSMAELGSALSERLRVAKTHFAQAIKQQLFTRGAISLPWR